MREFIGRHRPAAASGEEDGSAAKRRSPKADKLEPAAAVKLPARTTALLAIAACAFVTLVYTPAVYDHRLRPNPKIAGAGRILADRRYVADGEVNWSSISNLVGLAAGEADRRRLSIGLINFNATESKMFAKASAAAAIAVPPASPALQWEDLYPEWIDEEEEEGPPPACPPLPPPVLPSNHRFSIIAVKLPCNRSLPNWSRDVARLHLQLAAAAAAAAAGAGVHVLFVTGDCFPIPNLFHCKHLLRRDGGAWLYKPDIAALKDKLKLPVGSCELAVPVAGVPARLYRRRRREAYATILHSASMYVCGAIAAAQSIRQSGSARDLVILVDDTISAADIAGLTAAGWSVRAIERIRNPRAARDAYNEFNYSKFRLWQLTDYDRVIFIDADLLVLRSIDFLFASPELSATGNNATLFNSGVMVVEPSNCTHSLLMDHVDDIISYNGGDQGYLNEIFTWWHRIPRRTNFLKHFWEGDPPEAKEKKTALFAADPPELYVLHYLGLKPWLCFRDYDCNWNNAVFHEFASDAAHWRWWKVHDRMPPELRRFCLLRTKQKAGLEWDRRQAEKEGYADGHWRRNVSDPRLRICDEKFCYWESMLWHWGDANWTAGGAVSAPPRRAALPA